MELAIKDKSPNKVIIKQAASPKLESLVNIVRKI
jgi:hypothetical protein